MRLLHAKTFTFHEFFDEVPPYAILSHTWRDDEVTLKDMVKGRAKSKKGFQKILYCAEQALKDGYDYIGWIPAVFSRPAVPSYRKPSTRCTGGIRTRKSATLT